MRFLIADGAYPAFLSDHYGGHPGLRKSPYQEQLDALLRTRFGHSDFYSRNLRALGHSAADVILNAVPLQAAWAREHASGLARWAPVADHRWQLAVFERQVKALEPDVLLVHDMAFLPSAFVHHLRQLTGRVIGQVASPIDFGADWSGYDLVVSSLPHYVERFRALGVAAEYLALGFERSLLAEVPAADRDLDAVFVGSLSPEHASGGRLLSRLSAAGSLDVWGAGREALPDASPILPRHHGPAWGLEMFGLLARAKVALNRHIDAAAGYANNMRLFEATGMGACLLTDERRNLHELFDAGAEVVTYANADDCLEKIAYLLEHDAERQRVAAAGQQRTLRDHTYEKRMHELLRLIAEHQSTRTRRRDVQAWSSGRPSVLGHARRLAAASPAAPLLRHAHRLATRRRGADVSTGYQVVAAGDITESLTTGWRDEHIPGRQRLLVNQQLAEMRSGRPGLQFRVAAAALTRTGLSAAKVLEVGCASGYYREVLHSLTDVEIDYIGVDFSQALLLEARRHYPALPVVAGDAAHLPFLDRSMDVVLSAAVIMHMAEWREGLSEMARVAGRFCILHRTPVARSTPTTWLKKQAYGVDVVELVFHEREVLDQLDAAGVDLIAEWALDEYHLPGLEEMVEVKTYLGRVRA
jgi:2-polyprenyl-3-methyl-5-hydroxy-6-metoxy-1,4-benzoquinol methylase